MQYGKDTHNHTTQETTDQNRLGAPERTAENARVSRFRKRYSPMTPAKLSYNDLIKDHAAKLEYLIEQMSPGRHPSLALTHLEECVHWAVKHLTGDNTVEMTDELVQKVIHELPKITAD